MSKYYDVSDDSKSKFNDVFLKKSFAIPVKFQFVGSEKQKTLVKISKIPDHYSHILGMDLLVIINEDLVSVFDPISITILIEQEIDKITVNIDSGKIKMIKPDLNTFSSLINKYGVEKVTKANKVEELYQQQLQDGNEEFAI